MFEITKNTKQYYLKCLIYGQPGAGKTTLAGSSQLVSEMKDILYIDAESGSMSLSTIDDIDFVHVKSYSQFSKVFDFLRLHCTLRDREDLTKLHELHERFGIHPDKRYNTVVIDSITEVQKMAIYMLTGMEIGNVKLDTIPDAVQIQEWGQLAEMIRILIRSFRDLPMNSIFVAAEQLVEIQPGRTMKMPSMPGKLANEIQGFLDVVGYLTSRTEITEDGNAQIFRRLYLIAGKTFQAKNRFADSGVSYIDDPTMQKLYNVTPMMRKG
jgi:hypothetical protein